VGRRIALGVVVVVFLLVCVSSAAAGWQPVATGLTNIIQPAILRTKAGNELIAWNTPNGSLQVLRNGTRETLLSSLPYIGKPALVQQPDGTLQLYVPAEGTGLDGVVRLSSSDDGATWAAPVQTMSHDLADVGSATVRPDGTPLFTQSGTGFVDVFQGLNGETMTNVFTDCCGYAESVAVDSSNVARVAFWSNGNSASSRFVVGTLGGGLATFGTQTAPRDDRVPLVSFGTHTYLLWANGYPTAKSLILQRFSGGALTLDHGSFSGGDPHMALALEPNGRLWALWTKGGSVRAARSRTNGASFGATVSVRDPAGSTAYQLEALARPGSVDALLNTGAAISRVRLLPGLTVHATRKVATVLDDGFPVKGATLKGGGKTLHTDAKGHAAIAKLAKGTGVSVSAAGYTPTSLRVP
jgi:hypothetical protein